jgi:hypothetical protein
MLQCPVCSKPGFKRLTRHLSQTHGIPKSEALEMFPGLVLEAPVPDREVRCSSCGEVVPGASPRAAYVKCEGCRQTDDRPKVACAICGLERRRLGAHVKAAHGLTRAEYQEKYPDARLEVPGTRKRSEACRAKQSAAAKRRWSSEEERAAQSERLKESAPWKGKVISEEHRAAISEGGTGVTHNVSEENRRKMGERGRRVLGEIRDLPEVRQKMAEAAKRRHEREPFGLADPKVWRKGYDSKVRNGTLVSPNAGRGICGFRVGLDHYTRSTLEANFARVLIAAGVRYDYEPRVFWLGDDLGYYTPDFYLHDPLTHGEGKVLIPAGWLELKGWRHRDGSLPGKAQEKRDALAAMVEEPVTVLAGSDEVMLLAKALWQPGIPLWETQRRNLRSHPEVFGVQSPT